VSRPPVSLALAGAAVVACAASLACPKTPLRVDPGQVVEVETAYQTVRVVEGTDEIAVPGKGGPWDPVPEVVRERFLRFDEDTDSYQSIHVLGGSPERLTYGRYYDHVALGLWFEGMPWSRADASRPRLLILGYAGGTLARVAAAVAPKGREPDTLGVELDPDVAPLALARLDPARRLEPAATVRGGEDGRTVVAGLPAAERFDLVVVDAYQRTQYVPFQLATLEFFRACVRRTTPTGLVGINVIAPSGVRGRLIASLATTLSKALEDEGGGAAWVVANPHYAENAMVWGTRSARAPRVHAGVPASLAVPAAALERMLLRHVPGAARDLVLVDDRAPTEQMTDEGLLAEVPAR
jgi:spermidine synthase